MSFACDPTTATMSTPIVDTHALVPWLDLVDDLGYRPRPAASPRPVLSEHGTDLTCRTMLDGSAVAQLSRRVQCIVVRCMLVCPHVPQRGQPAPAVVRRRASGAEIRHLPIHAPASGCLASHLSTRTFPIHPCFLPSCSSRRPVDLPRPSHQPPGPSISMASTPAEKLSHSRFIHTW